MGTAAAAPGRDLSAWRSWSGGEGKGGKDELGRRNGSQDFCEALLWPPFLQKLEILDSAIVTGARSAAAAAGLWPTGSSDTLAAFVRARANGWCPRAFPRPSAGIVVSAEALFLSSPGADRHPLAPFGLALLGLGFSQHSDFRALFYSVSLVRCARRLRRAASYAEASARSAEPRVRALPKLTCIGLVILFCCPMSFSHRACAARKALGENLYSIRMRVGGLEQSRQ